MASVTTLPGAHREHRGLDHWIRRVLAEVANLRRAPDKDTVHDLRVAIRRCRSVAAVMAEVDPNPHWRELRHVPRKLFRRLGALRDAQITGDWVKTHGAENDRLRILLQEHFGAREPRLLNAVIHAAEKFDEKSWKRLDRKLRKRVRLVPAGSLAAECLALERLEEAKRLHARAIREQKPDSWHALRIGIKRFRYTVESFLPGRYEVWSPQLKRLQDILGELHDLDVLSVLVRDKAQTDVPELLAEWDRMIERARNKCLDQYGELTFGKSSVWTDWAAGLPQDQRAQTASMARLRVTARAADMRPRRSAQISRIAVAIFDAARQARIAPLFRDRSSRRILRAAARLSGIGTKSGPRNSRKAAWRYLSNLPVPPAWTAEEWQVLAWSVRYHRGAEPKLKNAAFARLSEDQQQSVRAVAGVLRLARGLRKCGTEDCSGIHADRSTEAVLLEIPGLADSLENAALLATAKHLLETYLQVPLILKPAPKAQLPIPELVPSQESLDEPSFAAASD
jgi:CHAD domain-containing protein